MAWLLFRFRTVGMDNIYKVAVNVVNRVTGRQHNAVVQFGVWAAG
jgi:hypothetical protein